MIHSIDFVWLADGNAKWAGPIRLHLILMPISYGYEGYYDGFRFCGIVVSALWLCWLLGS